MKYYVIGDDKSLKEGMSKADILSNFDDQANMIDQHRRSILALQEKVKNISSGESAPSGGSNGDIYIQY